MNNNRQSPFVSCTASPVEYVLCHFSEKMARNGGGNWQKHLWPVVRENIFRTRGDAFRRLVIIGLTVEVRCYFLNLFGN